MDLRVNSSQELLVKLEQTVSAFVKQEDQITRDYLAQRYKVTRSFQEAIEGLEAVLATRTHEVDTSFQEVTDRVHGIAENRRTRLQRSHLMSTRSLPRRVKEVRGILQGELQMKRYRLEVKLKADESLADNTMQEYTEQLSGQRNKLLKLVKRAKRCFQGYGAFQKILRTELNTSSENKITRLDGAVLLGQLHQKLELAEEQVRAFDQRKIPAVFSLLPLSLLTVLIVIGGVALSFALGLNEKAQMVAGGVSAALLLLTYVLYQTGRSKAMPVAETLSATLGEANRLHETCRALASSKHEEDRVRRQEEFERMAASIEDRKSHAGEQEVDFEQRAKLKLETQLPRALQTLDRLLQSRLATIDHVRAVRLQSLQTETDGQIQQLRDQLNTGLMSIDTANQEVWQGIETNWKSQIEPLYRAMDAMNVEMDRRFPPWSDALVEEWLPPDQFTPATKFARLDLDLTKLPHGLPKDPRLALPGLAQVHVPLALTFPLQGSILFETRGSGNETVTGTLNNIILRLLASTPPGKLSFTILDPVGLGQNFAGLMHLADYEESLINRRIWTQRDQIEERLAEMSEHIEKVIQMYLRNEYATITEYNEQAGSVAEKYHFLVVADLPTNFSETAVRRLQSIAASGPRCGIYTLIHWDQRQPLPDGFVADELRQNSVCIRQDKDTFILTSPTPGNAVLSFDSPPGPDLAVSLVHKIGASSIDSNRVQVPFSQITPKPEELWTNDSTNELRIAIGRTGATKHQVLAIGKGTRQHALFAGKTGSGKSTLFHVIITNLALAYSPDQVEFYLIDFKKGVEFKCYASKLLPHARVVAIESDREFALSVLQKVDSELKRRGDLFRKLGVQDIAGYKRAGGTEPMPRSLLIIDEFQEFFVEDDTIAQTASLLFDRIVRQGRAFGIHVLLGSQTLGGAYSLARATLGQMVIRVALQCNEADAYLIMDENNSAPRLLTRPGEGIYNDAAGALEGNSPFQVVWLPDDERDQWLDKVQELAVVKEYHHDGPLVFEGNAPAEIRENHLLIKALLNKPVVSPVSPRCWLGAPNSIKGPTEVVFHRQSGNHLLIVGQREEASVTMIGLSMLALAAQHPVGTVKFVLLQSAQVGTPDADFFQQIIKTIPHEVTEAQGIDIAEVMNDLATELKARVSGDSDGASPSVFVFIHGLHKYKKLRQEDDFSFSMSDDGGSSNPGAQFVELITEGSSHGMHIITTVDTFNNVNRSMSRKALSEFEMRVVFQMSANDSASLIDSPKAGNLGLHRALFYSEHEGTLETFRPYASPDAAWFQECAVKLSDETVGGYSPK
ncbi:hypothetical protein BH11VER1_BH11VER1_16260 [soil metagenome]